MGTGLLAAHKNTNQESGPVPGAFHTTLDSVVHVEAVALAQTATVQKVQAAGPAASSPLPKLMQHFSCLPSFWCLFSSEIYKLPYPEKHAFAHRCSVLHAVSDMDPRRL